MLEKKYLQKYAELLVHYSLGIKNKQKIIVKGSAAAMPLLEELYTEILKSGGFPFLRMSLNNQEELFYKNCKPHHLKTLTDISEYETKNSDGVINILSSTNTKSLMNIDHKKQGELRKTNRPLMDIILKKETWVLALYPTDAYAQDAEMSLSEFEDFIINAVKINKKEPVKEWNKIEKYQDKIIKNLKGADKVSIIGKNTDLSFSIKNRIFINSCGKNNMPSGEVFTTPVENSVNGHIYYEFPACYSGNEVSGVYLKFENGKVVKAEADKNEKFLHEMLNIDEGAKYLGEFAFGLNNGIKKFTKNILFDEKIGGTVHLALGNAYPETKGKNKSALHWDMIKDLRKNGEVKIDGKTVFKKGKYIF